MWPGILVQKITTKQPTDDMIEVAVVAIEEAMRADGEAVPPDGMDLARDPMPAPGETAATVRAAVANEGPVVAPTDAAPTTDVAPTIDPSANG
jgi:hypothetical protein